MSRIDVRKTYKLFIGGEFPRSESGHSYPVHDVRGRFVANAALASRKDARDAVQAARAAFGGWSGKTAYNRSQILYRVANVLPRRAGHVLPLRLVRPPRLGPREVAADEELVRLAHVDAGHQLSSPLR